MTKLREDGPACEATREIMLGLLRARDCFRVLELDDVADACESLLLNALPRMRRTVKPTVLVDGWTHAQNAGVEGL